MKFVTRDGNFNIKYNYLSIELFEPLLFKNEVKFSTLFPECSQNLVKKNPDLFSTYKDCNKFSMSNPPKAPSAVVLT